MSEDPLLKNQAAINKEQAIARAEHDLAHIEGLIENDHFTHYFLRRLKEKQKDASDRVLNDDSLSREKLEGWRMVYQEYEAIINMVESDKRSYTEFLVNSRKPADGSEIEFTQRS